MQRKGLELLQKLEANAHKTYIPKHKSHYLEFMKEKP